MKIRSGFVSNSSTSSFLLIGFEATQKQIDEYIRKYEEREDGYCGFDEDENGVALVEEQKLIGVKFSIEEYDTDSISFKDAEKYAKLLRKLYGKNTKIRVYAGTEQC